MLPKISTQHLFCNTETQFLDASEWSFECIPVPKDAGAYLMEGRSSDAYISCIMFVVLMKFLFHTLTCKWLLQVAQQNFGKGCFRWHV